MGGAIATESRRPPASRPFADAGDGETDDPPEDERRSPAHSALRIALGVLASALRSHARDDVGEEEEEESEPNEHALAAWEHNGHSDRSADTEGEEQHADSLLVGRIGVTHSRRHGTAPARAAGGCLQVGGASQAGGP